MIDSNDEFFTADPRRAVDAKYEAQKIAFAPYAFHTALALRNLGILDALFEAGDEGIPVEHLLKGRDLTEYGLGVLLEFGLSMEIVKIAADTDPTRYRLGKIGYFLIHDAMTRVNMDFMNDICYAGASELEKAVRTGKPEGLKELGNWPTIYEGLSRLEEKPSRSWFAFDHYYSDNAFSEALPVIFRNPVRKLMDIGGNTAKWSIACAGFNADVKLTIVDLPGQVEMAQRNIADAGFEDRIDTCSQNVLSPDAWFPEGFDAVWLSQFLDCFSREEITGILSKIRLSIDDKCDVWVLEPLWDRQKYRAATYSLHATSLYFTTMANGNSKMYSCRELVEAIEKAGYKLQEEIHELGQNDYSLLRFRRTGP